MTTKPSTHAFRLKMAKQQAEAFLRDEGITALPVDPFVIARSRDIEVKPKPDTAGGVSGMLLRHGNVFGILYATHIPSEGFQRFSVGHELGHYFLEGHIDHVLPKDGVHTSHAGFVSADPYELEADQFAAGLLMPSAPFKRALGRHGAGLAAIETVAELCKTSLTATAIRYAELTDAAVAIVISTGPTIDFCFMSNTIKSLPQLSWLRKGTPVPHGTATAQFNADARRIADGDRADADVDIMDWLGGVRSVRAVEQVVGLGTYGKTLTVLTCPSLQDDTYGEDDQDEEEGLAASWTPRFHR
jgi:Zn-dependent peptidase ImmA (M78 family)